MNILVTGGTGLIGQALIKRLNAQNAFVTVLTRNTSKAKKNFQPKSQFHRKIITRNH